MKEELAIRAAKLFTPKPWKHNSKPRPNKCCGLYCTKCKVEFTIQNNELDKPCTVPTPIDINDWNVAKKLALSVDRELFWTELSKLFYNQTVCGSFTMWLALYATPADYIEAAIISKEKELTSNGE